MKETQFRNSRPGPGVKMGLVALGLVATICASCGSDDPQNPAANSGGGAGLGGSGGQAGTAGGTPAGTGGGIGGVGGSGGAAGHAGDTAVPAPSDFRSTEIASDSIGLEWNYDGPSATFEIQRWNGTSWPVVATPAQMDRGWQAVGLNPDTQYGHRIRAVRGTAVSNYSGEDWTSTEAVGAGGTAGSGGGTGGTAGSAGTGGTGGSAGTGGTGGSAGAGGTGGSAGTGGTGGSAGTGGTAGSTGTTVVVDHDFDDSTFGPMGHGSYWAIQPGGGIGDSPAARLTYSTSGTANKAMSIKVGSYASNEFTVEFDVKVEGSPSGGSKFIKFFGDTAVHSRNNMTLGLDYNSNTNRETAYFGDTICTARWNGSNGGSCTPQHIVSSSPIDIRGGSWGRYKAWVKRADPGVKNGEVKVWWNGTLRAHIVAMDSNPSSFEDPTPGFARIEIGGYNHNNFNGTTWYLWIDNLRIETPTN